MWGKNSENFSWTESPTKNYKYFLYNEKKSLYVLPLEKTKCFLQFIYFYFATDTLQYLKNLIWAWQSASDCKTVYNLRFRLRFLVVDSPVGLSWASHSTLIYTSELILYPTICVHSATRHNIHKIVPDFLSTTS